MSRVSASVLLTCLVAATGDAAELRLQVTLKPSADDEWHVEYTVSPPVESLVFARGRGDYRRDSWSLEGSFFVIERLGATDRIRRLDDMPFTTFSARLTPVTEKPPGDYTPFVRFSDGSMAVFTGQFVAGVPTKDDAYAFIDGVNNDNAVAPIDPSITLEPGHIGRMVVDAEVVEAPTELELLEGEYVYFGHASTIQTPMLTAVTDDAAPVWLRDHLFATLAETYEYFGYRLGELPGGRPFLLTAFRPLEGGYVNSFGGVIGSQLIIDLGVGDQVPDTPDSRQFMARFFAHESAHLWHTGGGVPAAGPGSWMHEGSADALAWLALRDLQIDTGEATLGLFQQAANECVEHLAEGPLSEAGRRNEFQAFYACGAIIALSTHGLMRARGRDLFDFWRALLNSGAGGEDELRVDYYYLQVGQLEPGFDAVLQAFTEQTHDDPSGAVVELLDAGGVATGTNGQGEILITAMP